MRSDTPHNSAFVSAVAQSHPERAFLTEMIRHRTTLDQAVRARISGAATLEEAAGSLLELLDGGYAVWQDGQLIETRVLVKRLGRIRILIHTREHGPPHFHVECGNSAASFSITDGSLLFGDISHREHRLIEYWYRSARPLLVQVWNQSRPTDCPVGPITS